MPTPSDLRAAAKFVIEGWHDGVSADHLNARLRALDAALASQPEAPAIPEGACGVMGLCELPKWHPGRHETSVIRAAAIGEAPVSLDAAWREAEAALPENGYIGVGLNYASAHNGHGVQIGMTSGKPVPALQALAARLREAAVPVVEPEP